MGAGPSQTPADPRRPPRAGRPNGAGNGAAVARAARVPDHLSGGHGVPAARVLSTGSKLLRSPFPWSMVITGRSTTTPAKDTVPAAGEATGAPSNAATRSTPRCPLSHGWGGGCERTQHLRTGGERPLPGRPAAYPPAPWVPATSTSAGARSSKLFINPASTCRGRPGSCRPGHVENVLPGRSRCPAEAGGCSTLDGAVCCALNASRPGGPPQRCTPLSGARRHISFRSVGERWLTTRIQPSCRKAPAFPGRIAPPAVRTLPVLMGSVMDARSTAQPGSR